MFDLLEKVSGYDTCIFDLDNTIYDQRDYDFQAFKAIEKWLCDNYGNLIYSNISSELAKYKNEVGPYYKNLFDDVFSEKNLSKVDFHKCLEIYRNTKPIIDRNKTLYFFIEEISVSKSLYLITNGNVDTQKNKIDALGVSGFFKDIIFCDKNRPETLKPNLWAWDSLTGEFDLKKSVFIGDSDEIDGAFARNAGIDFIQFSIGDEYGS